MTPSQHHVHFNDQTITKKKIISTSVIGGWQPRLRTYKANGGTMSHAHPDPVANDKHVHMGGGEGSIISPPLASGL